MSSYSSLSVTTEQSAQPDILVVSRVFFPDAGGIQEYVYNRCLQDPERIIVLTSACSGDEAFDPTQPFTIVRWQMPPLKWLGKLAGLLKQIINLFWSVVFGVLLYNRYHYRSIEWCHGYDFPALLLLSYLLPVRCFLYLHGDDVLCPMKNPVLRWLFEWTLQRTEAVVCNSKFTKDYLVEHFHCERPTHIIHPTVRAEKFGKDSLDQLPDLRSQVRQKYGIPEAAIVILSVGRLVKRKGFDRVIEQLPALLAAGIDVYYLICGRGALEAELKQLAQRLDVQSRVIFAGYVPDENLASYYAACDLFAMLTFFDDQVKSIEGFGIVYLEAGYFGKPVIASRVGGVEDAVHHQENGLLVDPINNKETFEMLHLLCVDQALRQKLGRHGRELANRVTPHRLLYST
jgi:phosphatidylinositol alpha-1,6-mannosyltransferase